MSVRAPAQGDGAGSACGVAAEEGVKHGQLHALLVPPTPRHHRALAVGRVEVVAVARVRQAEGREKEREREEDAEDASDEELILTFYVLTHR